MNVLVQRIQPGAMRCTLGRFTTGVTVVTTACGGDEPLVRGAIARAGCSLHAEQAAGDQTLYLGRVEHHQSRPGEPLVFHAGAFGRRSGEEQVPADSWGWWPV